MPRCNLLVDVRRSAFVLLAAGKSSRMGSPKQLLAWQGLPLLQYQLREAAAVPGVTEVVVVLGHRADELRPLVAERDAPVRVHAVYNSGYVGGKTTSIKAGVAALERPADAIGILAVDQPRSAAMLGELLDAHFASGAPVTVPAHGGRLGHPPVFSWALLPEIAAITEEKQGLREVLERHRAAVYAFPTNNPSVLDNLNTDEDYRRAAAT